ncbi:Hypothetical predicted protein, partial [Pelobates cultripes]
SPASNADSEPADSQPGNTTQNCLRFAHSSQVKLAETHRRIKPEIQALGACTSDLEQRVESVVQAHNSVVQHFTSMKQHLNSLEMMVEDLSNHSRQNNLHIRGLPETLNEGQLIRKMEDYFQHLLPDILKERWAIDRAHRALRAQRTEGQ